MVRQLQQAIASDETPTSVSESAAAYEKATVQTSPSDRWNPNVPFHGTQEEWWEHFHKIEEGEFMSLEEYHLKFNAWKKEYLAARGIYL